MDLSDSRAGIGSAGQHVFIHVVWCFLASIGLLVSTWYKVDRIVDQVKFHFEESVDVFDFIVVGAGTSGAVVANRLSENPNWKILLIEAGGEPSPLHLVPGLSTYLLNHEETDWSHLTVPQKFACLGLKDQRSGWSQGKSLGGTSNLNYLIHLRGNPHDFGHWANITEDQSWTYENLLPYFRKSETYDGDWYPGAEDVHGYSGPVSVEIPSHHVLAEEFVNAGKELGYSHADLNGYYNQGFDYVHLSSRHGRRDAVYNSYIRPARERPNLTIFKYTTVIKVLLQGVQNEAYGVEFVRHGRGGFAYATKEIILSAGAIQTPKLLMLSGIGPSDHLWELGIRPKVDLPVGNNLQDHISTYLGPFIMDDPGSFLLSRDVTLRSIKEYFHDGAGPLSSSGVSAVGIFSSSWAFDNDQWHWPDMQILLSPAGVYQSYSEHLEKAFLLDERILENYYKSAVGKDSFTLLVSVGRPLSRGFIRLRSADPFQDLLIDPRYYEQEEDAIRMIEGMKLGVALAETTQSFRKFGHVRLTSTPLPGCEHVPYRTDAYWDCYFRHMSVSLHHIAGTAAMGRRGSPHAVVDPSLRVIGTKGLRVVDASVIPELPVSNLQAVCIMLGEKAADDIKYAWFLDPTHGGYKKKVKVKRKKKKKPKKDRETYWHVISRS